MSKHAIELTVFICKGTSRYIPCERLDVIKGTHGIPLDVFQQIYYAAVHAYCLEMCEYIN